MNVLFISTIGQSRNELALSSSPAYEWGGKIEELYIFNKFILIKERRSVFSLV